MVSSSSAIMVENPSSITMKGAGIPSAQMTHNEVQGNHLNFKEQDIQVARHLLHLE